MKIIGKISALLTVALLVFSFTVALADGVCEIEGTSYGNLSEAIYAANGKTVVLKSNATLPGGNLFPKNCVVDGGKKYKITIEDNITILNVENLELRNVTVDLNGKHFMVTTNNGNGSKLTLSEGAVLENGRFANGGAAIINKNATVVMEKGSIVRNCAAEGGGGGAFHVNGGTLILSGGKIENCTANDGGAVMTIDDSLVYLSGDTVITGNKNKAGNENNIVLKHENVLTLSGAFTGNVGVTIGDSSEGTTLGIAQNGAKGAEKIHSDLNASLAATIKGQRMFLGKAKAGASTAVPSTGQSGSQAGTQTGTTDVSKPVCYVGNDKNNTYMNIDAAVKEAKGATIHLLSDAVWQAETYNYQHKNFTLEGNGHKISVKGNIMILPGSFFVFKDVTIDLEQHHFVLLSTGRMKLERGAVIQNGKGANGAALINAEGEFTMEEGSAVKNCSTTGGGGAFHVNDGTLTLSGGEITGCTASGGGAIIATDKGKILLSGTTKVTENTVNKGEADNIKLLGTESLILNGAFTGKVGISFNYEPKEGDAFGVINGKVSGATNIYFDKYKTNLASIKDNKLTFAKAAGAVSDAEGPVVYEEPEEIKHVSEKDWKIECSSSFSPTMPGRIIDNDFQTFWHSGYTVEDGKIVAKDDPPFYVDITLPEETEISGFAITTRTDKSNGGLLTKIEFQIDVNGEYKKLGEYDLGNVKGTVTEEFLSNIAVKKVRVAVIDGAGGYGTISEFDLLEKSDKKPTAASYEEFMKYDEEHKLYPIDKSSASVTYDGPVWMAHEALLMLDGQSSFFRSEPKEPATFDIFVDLGEEHTLSAVSYTPRQDDSSGFWYGWTVSTSDDGEYYDEVASVFSRTFSYDKKYVVFEEPVKTRYLKFTVDKSYSSRVSCSELDFYQSYEIMSGNAAEEKYILTVGKNEIEANGETSALDTAPYIENGTTFIPLRGLLEKMGAEVSWSEEEQGVTVNKGNTKIYMQIRYKNVFVSTLKKENVKYTLLSEPRITDGRTFIPVRFVSEQLGYNVSWNGDTGEITITK